MSFQALRVIPATHPSLAGHFPGAPIVPGVVLLDEIADALKEWRPGAQLASIRTVKFLQPVKPGQPFTVSLSAASEAPLAKAVADRGETQDPALKAAVDASGNSAGRHEIVFSCRIEDCVAVEGRCEVTVSR